MRIREQSKLEEYLENLLLPKTSNLASGEAQARANSQTLNLEGISLSRAESHMLLWAVGLKPAFKAVEIGTLTGRSGLYILQGLQKGGTLWTLEKNPLHAQMAQQVLERFAAAESKNVHVVVGDARETMKRVEVEGPFDLIFIDGNKAAYGDYLAWAETHLKKGGILVADNVLLGGEIGEDEGEIFSKKQIQVMKNFNQHLLTSPLWKSVLIPTSEGLMISEKL